MPLYLDNNATTALEPRVLQAMMPFLQSLYGNPSSVHRFGRLTRDAIEQARVQVAKLAGAQPGQVIFTSGGTEANNLAIIGPLAHRPPARLAVSRIEHASLMEAAKKLSRSDWQLDLIDVDASCRLLEDSFIDSLHTDTQLVSVMLANNETGVLQDVKKLAGFARDKGVLFHTDASQAAGKMPLDFAGSGVHLMTLSAHKMYGPQGAGALIADRSVEIKPLILGGGQERDLRSGTENIAAIVGFGMAAELALQDLQSRSEQCRALRDALVTALSELPSVKLFAQDAERLPNTVQFAVDGFTGEALLMQLDRKGIAVSSGSACHSGQTEPSHVLLAMGVDEMMARSAIRVSFGKDNTAEDVKQFMDTLNTIVNLKS
jgi:cysteine desulfurase